MEEKRNTILEYGRELSDLVILSFTALSDLSSHYESWRTSRKQLIDHVEKMESNLVACTQRKATHEDILRAMNGLAAAVNAVPNPIATVAGTVLAMITGIFSRILAASSSGVDAKESSTVSTAVFRDAQASADLYASGLQCHQQFEKTARFVEVFHDVARELRYDDGENVEMTVFINGMLEYKPSHCSFYLKLRECLQELLTTLSGDFGRRFCEPFSYNPSAVEVVRSLNWRFRYQEFNPESVRFAMEQLRDLLQDNNVTVENLLANVKGLLELLNDELAFIETCFRDVKSFTSRLN